jgi:hypothetical protein
MTETPYLRALCGPDFAAQCRLSGVKQTSQIRPVMSAFDPKRTSRADVKYRRYAAVLSATWLTYRQAVLMLTPTNRLSSELPKKGPSMRANAC